jgi:hypothetical protein
MCIQRKRTLPLCAPSQEFLRLETHAARQFNALRIDPAIVLGKQGGDHGADVIGNASAAESRHIRNTLVDLRIVADHSAAEIGRHRSRRNCVDDDPAGAEFLAK